MREKFFSLLYSALWIIAKPFLANNKRLAIGFDQRNVPSTWPTEHYNDLARKPIIWIQAASGGEARLIKALLAEFSQLYTKECTFLCTSCTSQGLDIIKQMTPPNGCLYVNNFFPLDHPKTIERAINQAKPNLIVLLETEIWPGLLLAASKLNIPVIILNARMTEKSLKGYQLLKGILKNTSLKEIYAISSSDSHRFKSIFPKSSVYQISNIKFDGLELSELDQKSRIAHRLELGLDSCMPLIALSSIRQEEEDLIIPYIKKILAHKSSPILTIAPRHMHRISFWENALKKLEIPYKKRSHHDNVLDSTRCLIWDTFGELDALYKATDIAVIGGSFAKLGGQNFLEPLAYGVPVIVGESTYNFSWVGEELFLDNLVYKCSNMEDSTNLLETFLNSFSIDYFKELQNRQNLFKNWLQKHKGGSKKAATAIIKNISQGFDF